MTIAEFQSPDGGLWKVEYNPPSEHSNATRVFNVVTPDGTVAQSFEAKQPDLHNLQLLQAEKQARDKCAELAGWPINPKTGQRGWDIDLETGEHLLHGKARKTPAKPDKPNVNEPQPPLPLKEGQ